MLDSLGLMAMDAVCRLGARFRSLPAAVRRAVVAAAFLAGLLVVGWIDGHTPGSMYY